VTEPILVHSTTDGNAFSFKHVCTSSTATTVVFLNGSFFNFHQWDLLASRVNRQAGKFGIQPNLLFMDYRGFGNVPPLAKPITFEALRSDVIELLDAEGIDGNVVLAGSSLGSLVGLSLLAQVEQRFKALVVYGFAAPVEPVIHHVRGIFLELQDMLAPLLIQDGDERLNMDAIPSFANAMWEIFIVKYSRAPAAVKARGFNSAYTSYILKYMHDTPVSTIKSFLDFFTGATLLANVTSLQISPTIWKKVKVFHGKDDLITPFSDVNGFCKRVGTGQFKAFEEKGHTDFIINGAVCDEIATEILI
jgi:pimeloyl-ACP methyl ester carboxylesterase